MRAFDKARSLEKKQSRTKIRDTKNCLASGLSERRRSAQKR